MYSVADVEIVVRLYAAILFGHTPVVRQLLERYPVALSEVLDREVALELSLQFGDGSVFSLLTSFGADFAEPRTWLNYPALKKACQYRCYNAVRWMLRNRNMLQLSHADICHIVLVGEKEDVNFLQLLWTENLYPPTTRALRNEYVLIRLVKGNFEKAVRFVLTLPCWKEYLQQTDSQGRTPLVLAKKSSMIGILLEGGADPFATDCYGLYPFQWNLMMKRPEEVESFINLYRTAIMKCKPDQYELFWHIVQHFCGVTMTFVHYFRNHEMVLFYSGDRWGLCVTAEEYGTSEGLVYS